MSRQSSSDPLPFVQVDRAVKPKAALLAGKMGVTNQHALGSLIEFWDLCGDPRELEHVVAETAPGEEPALVLDRADVELRFELASGHHLEVGVLALAGLVEPHARGFRVRGMSRYFDPVQARMRARVAASIGGKASAESRRKANGTAQPRSERRSEHRSEVAAAGPEATVEAAPNGSRSDTEAGSKPIGQRSAVSGHLSKDLPVASRRGRPKPTQAELVPPPPDPRHAPLVARLTEIFTSVRGSKYPFSGRDAKAISSLLALADPGDLEVAWERALRHVGYPSVSSLSELQTNLATFIGKGPGGLKGDWRSQQGDYAKSWGLES